MAWENWALRPSAKMRGAAKEGQLDCIKRSINRNRIVPPLCGEGFILDLRRLLISRLTCGRVVELDQNDIQRAAAARMSEKD